MFSRTISAIFVGCALLAAPVASIAAAPRGPSTPEERKQALEYIQHFEADPLNPAMQSEREWVARWIIEIPDVHVGLCSSLVTLPKGDKKDGLTLFTAMLFAETAFLLQNPDRQDDHLAQFQAGVEGVLRVYEVLLKSKPKDRQPNLDDLVQQRDAGTLPQWVKERAAAFCQK
jgi:hypothetical protein